MKSEYKGNLTLTILHNCMFLCDIYELKINTDHIAM